MNKKTIISKTLLFVAIVGFIMVFQKVFGNENTLIGVTVITASLMFLQRDLTPNLFKFFILFLGINLIQGILAFLSYENIWFGLIGTFLSMFVTGYIFTYDLKSPMYIAFGLQYLFMLYTPVSLEDLPIRLIALSSGAFIVIIFQLILNKNRLSKAASKVLPSVVNAISEKIEKVISLNYNGENNSEISQGIKAIRKEILESRNSYFHTTLEGKIMLNITISLERANILIDRIYKCLKSEESICEEEKQFLNSFKYIIGELPNCRDDSSETKHLIDRIKGFIYTYKSDIETPTLKISSENIREMLENMDFLEHNLQEVVGADPKDYRKVIRKTSIPETFKTSYLLKKNFNLGSVKFSYAFRSALLAAIGYFLVKYFNLVDGKWLVFTLFSITQPYLQDATVKSINRIKGTVIGIVVFLILFSIVTDSMGRSLIILLAGYINSYIDRYDRQMIFITISALGVAAVTGSPGLLAFDRIVYVLVGIGVALLANRFILSYRIEDSTNNLMNMYNGIFKEIYSEIDLAAKGKGNIQKMRNLIMQTSLIEDRLYVNAGFESEEAKKKIEETLESHRIEINDLYDKYLGVHSKSK